MDWTSVVKNFLQADAARIHLLSQRSLQLEIQLKQQLRSQNQKDAQGTDCDKLLLYQTEGVFYTHPSLLVGQPKILTLRISSIYKV
jgi:hypothetical protein